MVGVLPTKLGIIDMKKVVGHLTWTRVIADSLEDESSQAENSGETSARESGGLASTGGWQAGLGRGGNISGSLGLGGGDAGAVGAGVADDRRDGGNWLGDSARAVGDGKGGRLSDGVGGATVGDLSRSRAVGGQGGDDLGGVGDVGPGVRTSGGSEDGSSGELHFADRFEVGY